MAIVALKNLFLFMKYRYKENSAHGIIWFINIMPSAVGFSIVDDSRSRLPLFWIAHFALLFYVYIYGGVVNSLRVAEGFGAIIKSYVSTFVTILVFNAGFWFLTTRSLVKSVLDNVVRIDTLFRETDFLREKYWKALATVRKTVFVYYILNAIDTLGVYIPMRMNLSSEFYAAEPCPGMMLTTSLSRHGCRLIIFTHDITVAVVVFSFQALLLFLIAHTTAMYLLLSEEIRSLDDYDGRDVNFQIKEKLASIIERHTLILGIMTQLKFLYKMPLGVHFASNAVCICLFSYLTISELISFSAVMVYCFILFFLYCYLCQKLVNASEDFEQAVYACGWEKFLVKEKKTVYVMLMIAQRPASLLAAGIVPVNMYTFATTLQLIYKFITAFKT